MAMLANESKHVTTEPKGLTRRSHSEGIEDDEKTEMEEEYAEVEKKKRSVME